MTDPGDRDLEATVCSLLSRPLAAPALAALSIACGTAPQTETPRPDAGIPSERVRDAALPIAGAESLPVPGVGAYHTACVGIHECIRKEESQRLARMPGIVRAGDTLIIALDDGSERRLTDRAGSAEPLRFYYGFPLGPTDHHLISIQRPGDTGSGSCLDDDTASFLLVHRVSGHVTELPFWPTPSPDGRRMVIDYFEGAGPGRDARGEPPFDGSRLQIWRVTPDGLELEWELRPEGWGPTYARWADGNTVRFRRSTECPSSNHCTGPWWQVRLDPGDGSWTLREETVRPGAQQR